jgi:hypothetical protein
VRQPDLLAALESVYKGRRDAKVAHQFGAFGGRAAAFSALCDTYHAPETYLGKLFAETTFEDARDDLPTYVTMLAR